MTQSNLNVQITEMPFDSFQSNNNIIFEINNKMISRGNKSDFLMQFNFVCLHPNIELNWIELRAKQSKVWSEKKPCLVKQKYKVQSITCVHQSLPTSC